MLSPLESIFGVGFILPIGRALPVGAGVLGADRRTGFDTGFEGKVAKWAVPDDVVIVPALPHGPTGKVLKRELRAAYQGQPLEGSR